MVQADIVPILTHINLCLSGFCNTCKTQFEEQETRNEQEIHYNDPVKAGRQVGDILLSKLWKQKRGQQELTGNMSYYAEKHILCALWLQQAEFSVKAAHNKSIYYSELFGSVLGLKRCCCRRPEWIFEPAGSNIAIFTSGGRFLMGKALPDYRSPSKKGPILWALCQPPWWRTTWH